MNRKKKSLIVALAVVFAGVIAGVGIWFLSGRKEANKPQTQPVTSYKTHMSDKKYDDVGLMIMNCDSLSDFSETKNLRITSGTNRFVEGTGAIALEDARKNGSAIFQKSVDITEYKDGSVHVSLYVNDVDYLNNVITLELTSSASYDFDEISWDIEKHWLQNGWNELYLQIDKAKATGTPNLGAINYFRIFTLKATLGLEMYMDNVYATKTIEDYSTITLQDEYQETEAKNGKMIMSCNTIGIFSSLSNMEVTTKKGEFVEGTGAMKVAYYAAEKKVIGNGIIANPVDVSAYKTGSVHLSLYVNQVSNLKNYINFELTSSGKCDVDEYNWKIEPADLKNGWNDVYLTFDEASILGKPDLKALNFFRIFSAEVNENLVLILDNVYATNEVLGDSAYSETKSEHGKMIMSCNTSTIFTSLTNMKLTTKKNEFVEGTGAFKTQYFTAEKKILSYGTFANPVNISGYEQGSVHLSLYVDDVSKLKNPVTFELSSSGKPDQNEFNWTIKPADLKNGWNDVYLTFEKAGVQFGAVDMTKINFFRLFSVEAKETVCMILDNVYATLDVLGPSYYKESASEYGQMIMSGNTTGIFSQVINLAVTTNQGEFLEGTGALKTIALEKDHSMICKAKWTNPVDISQYANGNVHVSLYVNKVSKLTKDIVMELTSSGTWDKEECEWTIKRTDLKDGWNELYLPIQNANKVGTPNFAAINYFRLFTTKAEDGLVFIIDNMYATMESSGAPIGGKMLISGNNLSWFSSYFNLGLTTKHQEGTHALKALNPAIECYGVFKEKLDISAYKKGGVHISIYVNKATYLKESVNFELTSSGTSNQSEYQWIISAADLKDGWNELYLTFASAKKTGKPDLGGINYFRMFTVTPNSKLELIFDDVYVLTK